MTQNRKATPVKTASSPIIPGLDACIALLRARKITEFDAAVRQLAQRFPRESKVVQLVGVAALMQGRLQQAVDALQAAARLNQNDPSIWDNLGVALNRAGHYDAAAECFQGSVRLNPDVAAVWVNAAANFADMGDHVLARNTAARAVELAPELPEAHQNLGNALRLLGDTPTAVKVLLRAIELDPECAPAHMGLARALQKHNQYELALEHAREAIRIDPDYVDGNLAYAMLCGDTEKVVDLYGKILSARPNETVASSRLFWMLNDPRFDAQALLAETRAFAARFEPRHAVARRPHDNKPDPDRPIRVGFVSGDLRRHAAAYHIEPLWRGLAGLAEGFKLIVYDTTPASDDMTDRLKAFAAEWVAARDLSDAQFDERIRADAIDVLIDCSGHTDSNRLSVFMRKPAPVQAHWLGYTNTTGLECMDYYIADPVLAPVGSMDDQFVEKLIRLPVYTAQLPPVECDTAPLPAARNGHVTFGSLCRPEKINENVVALWARVLKAVPDARMLLGVIPVEDSRMRIRNWFERNGVPAGRLEFRGRLPEPEYMALHNSIDILLDSFPFSGATTTTNALWMGVPVVTLAGAAMPQRQSAARLAAVGLEAWIAQTPEAFVDIAVRNAASVAELSRLRNTLPGMLAAAPALQSRAIAESFAAGLRMAWRRWCAGGPPAPIDLSGRAAG